MRSSWEWLVGTRYLRSSHRRGFVSFVALISTAGLTLGVAVLIVVLSVINGFERELRTRILSVTAHATLMGLEGSLVDWREVRGRALELPGVRHAVPYIEAQAMVAHGKRVLGSAVRGVDPVLEREATGLARHLQGARIEELTAGSWRVILGSALARDLGVRRGDEVVLIVPEGSATPQGVVPRMRRLQVVGTFESGMYEFDRGLALMNVADAARIYRLRDGVTGIRLTLDDPLGAPQTVRNLAVALGGGYYISDWTRNHANFFQSIELTKGMLFVILLIIVGDDREGEAVRHRAAAHSRRISRRHPAHLCAAGRTHRPRGHRCRCIARNRLGGQRGVGGSRHRARVRRRVHGCEGLLHDRSARPCRADGRTAGLRHGLHAVRAGHRLSSVACFAHPARRGAAP
jgi:hypothetical protein